MTVHHIFTLEHYGSEPCIAIDDAAMLQQPAEVVRYRDETIQLVREAATSNRETPSRPNTNPAIQSFWDIGASIRAHGNPGKAEYLGF